MAFLELLLTVSGFVAAAGDAAGTTGRAAAIAAADTIATDEGDLRVVPIEHASFVLLWRGLTIWVDPVGAVDPGHGLPAPDLLLVTHAHADHFDPTLVRELNGPHTTVVMPLACSEGLPGNDTVIMAAGDSLSYRGLTIEAVPAYNLTPSHQRFHRPGDGIGYVLQRGDVRVYIAGDTEDIPEMRALTDITAAFLPVNQPYTMTVEQAAAAVRAFRPRIVYPYHYRNADKTLSDLDRFTELVGDASEVRRLPWYPSR